MCGIIGYVGQQPAVPILINGLKRLEYRGYDSSGIGVVDAESGSFEIRKSEGKIKNLEKLIASRPVSASPLGISHTRWATHGAPNQKNAHPHSDASGKILLVHNGIIENYEILKTRLQNKGVKFISDTDTEVIAQLIGQYYKNDFYAAVKKAVNQLEGAFALGVICVDHPDQLIAVRVGSPLIIGRGKHENFFASDVPAILEYTRDIIYLNDRRIAVITKDRVDVTDFEGKPVAVKAKRVDFALDAVQKQGYDHFMLKEMH
ncbi:MAG: glutamine--fructose-6-phosphate aminotransferase, partial [Candidatus Omnitrophica bacterium CG12_big_fil_rev_8_21_14_0_65_50_5]